MAKGINTTCDEGQTPIVAFHPTQDPISSVDGLTHSLGCGSSRGCATAAVAFTKSKRAQSITDDETWVPGEVSPTMSCFDQGDILGTPATKAAKTTDVHVPLRARQPGQSEASTTTVVAAIGFDAFQSGNPKATHQATDEGTGPLIRHRPHCVATPMAVRRLTPRECERLQGFPDDYTLVEYRKKPAADGPRYRALGNSMAVPVMRWIGERIQQVDRL
jgi:site-specific DNA-cytosine methylase